MMLHITDGESVAGTLRESAVPGEVRIYGDLMYEGPVEAESSDHGTHFISENFGVALSAARDHLAGFEETLRAISRHDEAVLWLDHRLSDQLILIRILAWFSAHPNGRLSLICIGQYPGVNPFVGLGQLNPEQLAALLDSRLPVSDSQLQLARTAWTAFTSPDPFAIERVAAGDISALPFLAASLRRHLEQFPSVDQGLSRTELQAVTVLRDHTSLPAGALFSAVQATESPLFMGDLSFFRMMRQLATARHPLIDAAGTADIDHTRLLSITDTGRRVLDGREDHVRLNGIDRWLGGVHLKGDEAAFRWDGERLS